ncbi:hypothetical protein KI387_019577, partial [Taxus chinensis]
FMSNKLFNISVTVPLFRDYSMVDTRRTSNPNHVHGGGSTPGQENNAVAGRGFTGDTRARVGSGSPSSPGDGEARNSTPARLDVTRPFHSAVGGGTTLEANQEDSALSWINLTFTSSEDGGTITGQAPPGGDGAP